MHIISDALPDKRTAGTTIYLQHLTLAHCTAITCAYSFTMFAAAGVWLGVGVGVAVSLGVMTLTVAVLITIFKCKDLKM